MTKTKPCIQTLILKFGSLWPWLLRLSDLPRYVEIHPVDAIARENVMAKRLS